MEFTCRHQALMQGLTAVERAVASNSPRPVLAGIYLEAKDNQLRMVATDLELSIECYVPAVVIEPGKTVLDGKVLSQIVRKLDSEDVAYTSIDAAMGRIEGGKARFSLHTLYADEFPTLPELPNEKFWRISQNVFKRMVKQTIIAVSTDEAQPSLNGVLLEVENDELRMVATDINRLAFKRAKLAEPTEALTKHIVPARTLQELTRLLSGEEDSELEFMIAGTQVVFKSGSVTIISRLIEGEFPEYRRAFPQTQPTRFRVNRTAFLAAVERASLIARRSVPPVVKLVATADNLSVSSQEAQVGQVYDEVGGVNDGEPGEATYQAFYIMEALRAMDTEEVIMEIGEGLRQGSMRPVGESDYLYVLMPVRVG
ncbi:MAG TPA: DNA polymerase III subunit beta [Firmicutes bacterium]|jgi:DNA polymerase-3 subunit beta|nr:DNA polymerase III subunit beta [Bacillota bacterium]